MSHGMRFPTMWPFDMKDSDKPLQPPFILETPDGVQSVA